jgi:protein-S-isoprenylcysteine O-methyltransferase Ste14
MTHSPPDTPGVLAPPPLIFLSGLAIGLLLTWIAPRPFLPAPFNWIAGSIFIAAGLLLGLSALLALRRGGTPADPYEAPVAIVTGGPYRFSRNPIYLGFNFIYIGVGLLFNSAWALLLLPIVLVVIHLGVIVREERYLERKFGQAYLGYKASVRRWL